jgi:hypothetical protein
MGHITQVYLFDLSRKGGLSPKVGLDRHAGAGRHPAILGSSGPRLSPGRPEKADKAL